MLLQRLIRGGRSATIVVLLCIGVTLALFLSGGAGEVAAPRFPGIDPGAWIGIPALSFAANGLLLLVLAWLLQVLSFRYSLIPTRTALPSLFFLLLFALSPIHAYTLQFGATGVALPVFTGLLVLLFAGYQQENSSQTCFAIGLLTGAALPAAPPLLWLLPFLIAAAAYLFRFTARSLAALLIGLATPLFIAGAFLPFDRIGMWVGPVWDALTTFRPIPNKWLSPENSSSLFLLLLSLVCTVELQSNPFDNKIQTRRLNRVVNLFPIYLFGFIFFLEWASWLFRPLFYLILSLQLARIFSQRTTRTRNFFFWTIVTLLIALYGWSLF